MLTVSLLIVMPKNFLPIVTSPVAEAPLLEADLDMLCQLSLMIETLTLDAVQVAEEPV